MKKVKELELFFEERESSKLNEMASLLQNAADKWKDSDNTIYNECLDASTLLKSLASHSKDLVAKNALSYEFKFNILLFIFNLFAFAFFIPKSIILIYRASYVKVKKETIKSNH